MLHVLVYCLHALNCLPHTVNTLCVVGSRWRMVGNDGRAVSVEAVVQVQRRCVWWRPGR